MTETASQPRENTAPAPATYLWILTLQWNVGNAQRLSSRAGQWTPRPGDSRADALDAAVTEFNGMTGADAGAVILFFSLEPNDL